MTGMGVELNTIIQGDCLEVLKTLPDECVQCIVTSPPYWGLRDYGVDGQIGLEKTPDDYVTKLVEIFREIRRVLRKDGTVWLNLGDSYASNTKGTGGISQKQDSNKGSRYHCLKIKHNLKNKDLCGIPWRVAFALQSDGWWLRQDIIWHKPNPMPESVTDRCTKAHEYIFLLTKSAKYYYDVEAIKEKALLIKTIPRPSGMERQAKKYHNKANYGGGGSSFQGHSGYFKANGMPINPDGKRNKRSVWTVTMQPLPEAHFATFPEKLIEPCIVAGTRENDLVLDPFMGAGTTAVVAIRHQRQYLGIELNPEYIAIANTRIKKELDKTALFNEVEP